VALLMAMMIGITSSTLLLLLRQQVPWLYTNDSEVRAIATSLLLFAALYQLSDAWQVTISGILRGFEDTTVPMFITLLAYWGIGLPIGYCLALTDLLVPAMGPQGFWIGLLCGLTAAALMLSVRLAFRLRRHATAS